MRYWVRLNRESIGPLTPEEIRRHPQITEGTLVFPEDKGTARDWVKLRTIPELMALCAREVPPPLRHSVPPPPPEDMEQASSAPPRPPPLPPSALAGSLPATSNPQNFTALQSMAIIITIFVLVLVGCFWVAFYQSTVVTHDGRPSGIPVSAETHEGLALKAAETIVSNNLRAPSTMRIVEEKLIDHKDEKYLISVTVDAQNAFGAMIRSTFLVVVSVDVSKREYHWKKGLSVQEVSYPPDQAEIDMMKSLNDWK